MTRTFIIAEAGVNHNGSIDRALAMVAVAAAAGADAIKFQSFKTEHLVTAGAPKADYQKRNLGRGGGQFEMLKALELTADHHFLLRDACKRTGIEFMSTPFDPESAAFLIDMKVKRLKVASGEMTNAPLLLQMARSRKPIILSTGMATLEEIRGALSVLAFGYTAAKGAKPSTAAFARAYRSPAGRRALKKNVTLLHCASEYPAPAEIIHLRAMETLGDVFGLPVGLSDHSTGIDVSVAAVARGAAMIEKHFTLDRNLPGPDHKASLTVDELYTLVSGIRTVEKALGRAEKKPSPVEVRNRAVARKSLVALAPIRKGEVFTDKNLGAKRPGGGVAPMRYWSYLGKKSRRAYAVDDLIKAQ